MTKNTLRVVAKKEQGQWREYFEEFLRDKRAEGCAPRTIADYVTHVGKVFAGGVDWDVQSIRVAAKKYLSAPNIAPATYNMRLKNLRTFFRWCVCEEQQYLDISPVARFKIKKASPRIVHFSADQITQLLEVCDQTTYPGLRDYCLIVLTLDTGIRPGEALQLLPGDLDLRGGYVHVPQAVSKTRTARTMPLSRATIRCLGRLLAARPTDWGPDARVFCTRDGNAQSVHAWTNRCKLYARQLGFKFTAYSLRHVFALEFVRAGGNVFALQRIMGHADLDMTRRYLALEMRDLEAAHAQASPIQRLLPAPKTRAGRIKK